MGWIHAQEEVGFHEDPHQKVHVSSVRGPDLDPSSVLAELEAFVPPEGFTPLTDPDTILVSDPVKVRGKYLPHDRKVGEVPTTNKPGRLVGVDLPYEYARPGVSGLLLSAPRLFSGPGGVVFFAAAFGGRRDRSEEYIAPRMVFAPLRAIYGRDGADYYRVK